MSFLTDTEAKQVTDKCLAHATAPETQVYLNPARTGNTRFARNSVSTSGYTETCQLIVTSQYGKRSGTAQTNQLDEASLADVVARAEEMARLAPEDPEVMPLLGPQTYKDSPSLFSEDVAGVTADFRAKIVAEAINSSKGRGFETAGLVQHFADADVIANNKGLFAHRRTSSIAYSLTVRSGDSGSGWGGGIANRLGAFDTSSMTARAVDLAARTANPVALEPGNYTTILSAECVADLASTLGFGFDRRAIDEGRSFLSKFQKELAAGQKFLSEKVHIYSDPASALCPGNNFDFEGSPTPTVDIIKEGVVKSIFCSRYWASEKKRAPEPFPSTFIMDGGTSSMDEMIQSTKRGILVTRFWYVRPVDPQTALFTGLTRDGCFLIENGKVTRPVKNFRWNETPVKMLRNIELMGPTQRVITSEQGVGSSLAFPPLKVTDFTFSSLSDAV